MHFLFLSRFPIFRTMRASVLTMLLALAVACGSSGEVREGGSSADTANGAGQSGTDAGAAGTTAAAADYGEAVNRVRYVVGEVAITEVDIQKMAEILRQTREGGPNPERKAVDVLVERAIVNMEAERESIIVSAERMENEIRRRQLASGAETLEDFRKNVERQTGASFEAWVDQLRFEIIKRQLIQIKLTVEQPGEDEVEKFYRQHRSQVGIEVRYREMIFVPRSGSIEEEARVSRLAQQAHDRVRSNPSSFGDIARSIPENVSPLRGLGGLQDYIPIQSVAERDVTLAGVLFNASPGMTPRPFRISGNRYMVVRVEGKRPVPLSRVRDQIRQRLYFDKENEAFEKWMAKRRKEIAIVTPE